MGSTSNGGIPGVTNVTLSPGGGFLLEPAGSATVLPPVMLDDLLRMMQQTAVVFVRRVVDRRLAEFEAKKPGVMRGILEKAGAVGLLGHDIPEAFGGLGGDKTSSSLITEAVGRVGSFGVSY